MQSAAKMLLAIQIFRGCGNFLNRYACLNAVKQSFKNCLRSKFASKMSSKTGLHFGGQFCNTLSRFGVGGALYYMFILSHRLLKHLVLNTCKRKGQGWGGLGFQCCGVCVCSLLF